MATEWALIPTIQVLFLPPCHDMYRVFLGAPPLSALLDIPESESNISSSQAGPPTQPTYHWQTVSSTDTAQPPHQSSYGQSNDILWGLRGEGSQSGKLERTESLIYPPATLEAASRRISIIYKNAIFDLTNVHVDGPEEEEELSGLNENNDTRAEGLGGEQTRVSCSDCRVTQSRPDDDDLVATNKFGVRVWSTPAG